MLLFSLLVASLAIAARASPAPQYADAMPKADDPASTGSLSTAARPAPTYWWSHHGHSKWRSAWPSAHAHGHRHAHHAHAFQAESASTTSSSSAYAPLVTPSPSSTPAYAPPSTSSSSTPPSTSSSSAPPSTSSSSAPPSTSSSSAPPSTSSSSAPPSTSSSSAPPSTSSSSTPTTPAPSSATPAAAKNTTQAVPASAAAYLDPHNALRAKHGAQPLAWSAALAGAAQTWASKCQWKHSDGAVGNYGENIAAGTGSFDAASAVAAWAAEESQYNPANPVFSHYTQMVWKASTQLGCAVASCPGLINSDVAQFHVCEYNPAGNVLGEFPQNVS